MFIDDYLEEVSWIANNLDKSTIKELVGLIYKVKRLGGRFFFLGLGGGAANASHAVNDFRKLCNIEAYSPIDNIPELTALINDDGWDNCYVNWLKESKLNSNDLVFIFSVGGGSYNPPISVNLINAINFSNLVHSKSIAVLGRDGGEIGKLANSRLIIPSVHAGRDTPHTEEFQNVILHLLVSYFGLQENKPKWESLE